MYRKGNHDEKRDPNRSQKTEEAPKPGNDCRADFRGGAQGQHGRDLPPGGDRPELILPVEVEIQGSRDSSSQRYPTRQEAESGSGKGGSESRTCKDENDDLRSSSRTSAYKKKRSLGLQGSLKGRHLSFELRSELLTIIDEAVAAGEPLAAICRVLEVGRRAVYRWRHVAKHPPKAHGGGGGFNKLRPAEERMVLKYIRLHPQLRCRRIAYDLERTGKAYVGKTTVAAIMRANGLNHPFERKYRPPMTEPGLPHLNS